MICTSHVCAYNDDSFSSDTDFHLHENDEEGIVADRACTGSRFCSRSGNDSHLKLQCVSVDTPDEFNDGAPMRCFSKPVVTSSPNRLLTPCSPVRRRRLKGVQSLYDARRAAVLDDKRKFSILVLGGSQGAEIF